MSRIIACSTSYAARVPLPMPASALAPHRTLILPTHPGVQYHFCRVGLPTYFLGHWDQFQYWRPQPPNVVNLLPAFEDAHLDWGPGDFDRELASGRHFRWPEDFDLAWLMFNWQWKLFRGDRRGKKLYRVAKTSELERADWEELLGRDDFTVVSFYPNTVERLRELFGVDVPYVPLGLDPAAYGPWDGGERRVLSIIHSWRERGWHYATYREATRDLPTLHVDHLDPEQPTRRYEDLVAELRRCRVYLHDGEQEYTITLIEALMTGMPVVAFAIPGIERYVRHGWNGFVGRTAAEIRDACRNLLDDDALAAEMGRRSRELAERDYGEARWRADWLAAVDALVRRR